MFNTKFRFKEPWQEADDYIRENYKQDKECTDDNCDDNCDDENCECDCHKDYDDYDDDYDD